MKREASAEWRGDLQHGQGSISTPSRVLAGTAYSFRSRFADGTETNPEELIAAAHAACFSMALSAQLGEAGLKPDWIRTQAVAQFENVEAGWTVTSIHLKVLARVPGADRGAFDKAAAGAKSGCPVSRLLNTKITMEAVLEA